MNEIELARESYELRQQIEVMRKRLMAVNQELYKIAAFPDGKNTAHIDAGAFKVKVQKSSRWTWDQEKLRSARRVLGDDVFLPLFKYEWTPVRKADVEGFIKNAPREKADLIIHALTVKPGVQVSVEIGEE